MHLVPAYFDVVRDNVADTVIKIIVHNFIVYLHKEMHQILKFIQLSEHGSLFNETQHVIASRTLYEQKLKRYYEARKVLNEISSG